MSTRRSLHVTLVLAACLFLAACAGRNVAPQSSAGTGGPATVGPDENVETFARSSLWDAFGPNQADQSVSVNRYIWAATFDILNFLPIQSVDPFTGVIVTGFGAPPGGGRTYRATVHVRDPALDARSLNVSLQSRNGAVNAATTRAVEDAILARARQLRIRDRGL